MGFVVDLGGTDFTFTNILAKGFVNGFSDTDFTFVNMLVWGYHWAEQLTLNFSNV